MLVRIRGDARLRRRLILAASRESLGEPRESNFLKNGGPSLE